MGAMASQIISLTIFTQPFIQEQIKENIKAPRDWPLCRGFTNDRWIPCTNGQMFPFDVSNGQMFPFDDVIMWIYPEMHSDKHSTMKSFKFAANALRNFKTRNIIVCCIVLLSLLHLYIYIYYLYNSILINTIWTTRYQHLTLYLHMIIKCSYQVKLKWCSKKNQLNRLFNILQGIYPAYDRNKS